MILICEKLYIKANIYYQQEMQEHYKTTSDRWEKIVLFLGKWISDFGQSWVRPLLWIVLLTVIVLSFIHLDKFSFDYIFSNKLNIWNEFWEFLNPFSKSVQEKYKDIYSVWMIHKLLMTVFIYHFVVAIKRKTKR